MARRHFVLSTNRAELAPFFKDFEDPSILKKLGAVISVFLEASTLSSKKRVHSPFHHVVAAPDGPVSIVIVGPDLRAPYCTNTIFSVLSLRVRSLPVWERLPW